MTATSLAWASLSAVSISGASVTGTISSSADSSGDSMPWICWALASDTPAARASGVVWALLPPADGLVSGLPGRGGVSGRPSSATAPVDVLVSQRVGGGGALAPVLLALVANRQLTLLVLGHHGVRLDLLPVRRVHLRQCRPGCIGAKEDGDDELHRLGLRHARAHTGQAGDEHEDQHEGHAKKGDSVRSHNGLLGCGLDASTAKLARRTGCECRGGRNAVV
jgi:hypothetical protein